MLPQVFPQLAEAPHALAVSAGLAIGAQAWRRALKEVSLFFTFGREIRRVINATNAVEGLNRVIRKAIETRGAFPSEKAAEKLVFLAIHGHEKTARTVRGWLTAVNGFAILRGDRLKPIQGRGRSR